jgi:hypothetical protein
MRVSFVLSLLAAGSCSAAADGVDRRCAGAPDSIVDPSSLAPDPELPQWERAPQPWSGQGAVADAELAKRLASEILAQNLGTRPRLPLSARLENGIWFIEGAPLRDGYGGGNLYIQLCQSNGRILNMYGTQ